MQNQRDQCPRRRSLPRPCTLLRLSTLALGAAYTVCRSRSEDGVARVDNYQAIQVNNSTKRMAAFGRKSGKVERGTDVDITGNLGQDWPLTHRVPHRTGGRSDERLSQDELGRDGGGEEVGLR